MPACGQPSLMAIKISFSCWRENHKLDEWVELCKVLKSLPYAEDIIVPVKKQEMDNKEFCTKLFSLKDNMSDTILLDTEVSKEDLDILFNNIVNLVV